MAPLCLDRGTAFDLCAVCGDFVSRTGDWTAHGEPDERLSAEEGEISAILGKEKQRQKTSHRAEGARARDTPSERASSKSFS